MISGRKPPITVTAMEKTLRFFAARCISPSRVTIGPCTTFSCITGLGGGFTTAISYTFSRLTQLYFLPFPAAVLLLE